MITNKRSIALLLSITVSWTLAAGTEGSDTPALKVVFKEHFLIGGAFNRNVVTGNDPNTAVLAIEHFNTATSENDMK